MPSTVLLAMKQRVITALIALPIVLALVFSTNPIWIFLLAIACVFFCVDELVWLIRGKSTWIPYGVSAGFAGVALLLRDHYDSHIGWTLGALALVLLVAMAVISRGISQKRTENMLVPGIFWIAAPVLALLLLHYSVPKTRPDVLWWPNPLLMALVPLWVGDTVAILVGRKFGKTLLAPTISPKKTWEGAIANLLGCTVAGVALASSIGLTSSQGLAVGIVAGVLGQVGDLFESSIKRVCDAKDSGWLMPGHGGLLDRVDSLLLPAIPIAALILFFR